jgi:hypothetical protein
VEAGVPIQRADYDVEGRSIVVLVRPKSK